MLKQGFSAEINDMATVTYIAPQGQEPEPHDAPSYGSIERAQDSEAPLRHLIGTIWRRRWIIIATIVVAVTLATLFVFQITPRYTASAQILVETRQMNVLNIQAVVPGLGADYQTNETEAAVLRSRELAKKVVELLNLTANPAFNPELRPPAPGIMTRLFGEFSLTETVLGLMPDFVTAPIEEARERRRLAETRLTPERRAELTREWVVDYFLASLNVTASERSRAIRLDFTAEDPELAAEVVNALADTYVLQTAENKRSATNRASDWLERRAEEVRERMVESERNLAGFRRDVGLIDIGQQVTLMTQQLVELNRELIDGRSKLNEAEARYAQVQQLIASDAGLETAAAVLQSQLIQRLREQESEVARQLAELRTQLREGHPRFELKRSEMRDIREKIAGEIDKIGINLRNEVELARVRVQNTERAVKDLEQTLRGQSEAQVKLKQLESDARSERELYERLRDRFRETGVQEDGDLTLPDARVISYAVPPEVPSYPNKKVMIAFAFVVSAALGVMLVFVAEHLDAGFRSVKQLEMQTGIPTIAVLPRASGGKGGPQELVLSRPGSVSAEAVRSLRTALLLSDVDHPPRSVLFTSSVPGEGKTTTALAVARASARAGQRVILVDTDLRHPSLHYAMGVPNNAGLVSVLSGEARLEDVIEIDPRSGMHFLTAGPPAPNPPDLLGSARMQQVLMRLKDAYDLVVVDTPPVLAVADVLVLLRQIDKCVFVIRWGRTHREAAYSALKQLLDSGADLVGTVLSQVDLKKHAQYHYGTSSGYYQGYYKEYYGGG